MREKIFFNMGKWSADYDSNAVCTAVFYDKAYLDLLGVGSVDATDSENHWKNIIHPDDLPLLDAVYDELFLPHPEGMDYDFECRMLVEGEYRWYHLFGHCVRREDGTVSHIDGVLFDIQDIVDGQKAQKALAQNNIRFFALEDDFEALYDVDLESGRYVSYGRDEFNKRNVSDKVVSSTEFFRDLRTNVERVVCAEDREAVYHFQTREAIVSGLAEKDHLDMYYRVSTDKGPMWLKMRIVYRDSEKKNVIVGIFNAEEEMAAKQKETRAREELAQTNLRLFALEDNFESLYDVELDSGRYDVFVKGDFFKSNVANKLSTPGDYFKELRANIDAVIYAEDKEGLYNALTRESMRRELAQNDHFDYYYRLNAQDGPIWFRMRIVYKDAEKKNVIIGVFNASKDVEARQIADQKAKLEEEQRRTDVLHEIINSGKWSFYVNAADEVIGADYSEAVQRIINNDLSDEAYSWLGIVHPDDKAEAFAAFRAAVEDHTCRTPYDVTYRMRDRHGVYHWFHSAGRIIRDAEGNGELFGVHIDITNQIEEQLEQKAQIQESLTFTNFFLDTYISAYYVDFNDLSCQIYKRTNELETEFPIITNYLDSIREYINRDVHPEDRAFLLKAVKPENMAKMLREKPEYSHIFRDLSGGTEKYYRMQVIRGAESNHAAFGFIDITDEVNEQRERVAEADKTKKLVESVAVSYDVAYAVNMAEDSYTLLKNSSTLLRTERLSGRFSESAEELIRLVHPSDRERMRRELDYGTVRANLRSRTSYDVEYRVVIDGATSWHQMNVTQIDEDNVALGFADRDLELMKLRLEEKRFEEYFALFVIDVDTGMLKTVLNKQYYGVFKEGEAVPFSAVMREFAASLSGEAQAFFMKISDLTQVRIDLSNEDKRTFCYKSERLDNRWIDVTAYAILRHEDGTPAMVTLGFSFVDTFTADRQELQNKLTENMQLIGVLADGYDALYYVNIDEHIYNIYTLNEQIYPEAGRMFDSSTDIYEIIRAYGHSEHIHPDDRRLFDGFSAETIREKLTGNKKYSIRFRIGTDGEYRWNEMDIVKSEGVDEQANAVAIGFAVRDSVIRAEQEYQQQLEAARNAAEAANEAKTNFLFSMSHDIRTPMNAITGFTNMAIKHIDDREKVLDCLSKTQKAGSMLLSLINSVLEVSRIESGNATIEEQYGDVYYSFANIDHTMRELADTKDIRLSFEFGDIRDRFVFADFSRCMRIFVNVISNAIKYTPEGGTVRVRCEQIGTAENGCAMYRYTVTDNGIGMSEEFQKHVFDQFARENTSTVSGIQGSGLGMSVVKAFAELMGGTVDVQSQQGSGTTITVTLPFRLQEGSSYTDPVTGDIVSTGIIGKAQEEPDFTGKSVLLVEDNELNREIATDILEEEGLMVEDADDGTVAVERLRMKGPEYYDFILMDIQMPVMNGFEATKAIRAMYPNRHIPIIALSANAFAEDRKKSTEAGMDGHVAKPINIKELFSALAKFM